MKQRDTVLHRFLDSQLVEWEQARVHYNKLKEGYVRKLCFTNCHIIACCNPERLVSSAAQVDPATISARPCFLCATNRPPQQKGLDFGENYTLLLNPYPIFPHHLTVVDKMHRPQQLDRERIETLLALTEAYPAFTFFYNGPNCGASAPDHFHFQAGDRHCMPAEKECMEQAELIYRTPYTSIKTKRDDLRRAIVLSGNRKEEICTYVLCLLDEMNNIVPNTPEAMVSIIAFYEDTEWHILLFPRKGHRPREYHAAGEEQIIFSPGAVDFGGRLIFPRKKDFDRIDEKKVKEMFAQLTFGETEFQLLQNSIRFKL